MENKVLLDKLQGVVRRSLDMDEYSLMCFVGYIVGSLEADVHFNKVGVEDFVSVLERSIELASYGRMK